MSTPITPINTELRRQRISSVKCQTTNSFTVRSMTIRLYLIIISFDLLHSGGRTGPVPKAPDFFPPFTLNQYRQSPVREAKFQYHGTKAIDIFPKLNRAIPPGLSLTLLNFFSQNLRGYHSSDRHTFVTRLFPFNAI